MNREEEEDVVLKVLHTADWHLGRRFPNFDEEDARKLMRARLEAVGKILQTADQYQVHALLCAGDLFDQPDPGSEVVEPLLALFRKKDRAFPVFLLPGNHDPLTTTSVYREGGTLRTGLPKYVHVIDRDDFTCNLTEDAVLHAVPCRSQAGQSDPTEKIPPRAAGDDRIRIGMVHGQTFHFKDYQTTFPIAQDAAKRRGLDYLALGDTHAYRDVADTGPPMIYPSTPEPATFGETESGFAAMVLFHHRPRPPVVRKHPIAYWRWQQKACHSLQDLREVMNEPELQRAVIRLTLDLRGTVPELEELETLLRELKGTGVSPGRVGILRIERKRVEIDTSSAEKVMVELPDVLKNVVVLLQEKQTERGEVAAQALQHLYRLLKELR